MRKKKKDSILSLLQSYREAHSTLRDLIIKGKKEEAASLMVLCQEGMGKIEEDSAKEKIKETEWQELSSLFISYQKAILLSYQTLFGEDILDCDTKEGRAEERGKKKEMPENEEYSLSKLQEAVDIFENIEIKIKNIPLHTLILFLPYKASMWDSMESVYLAARKDESCEALVMPITYFERKEDTQFGEAINEAGKFPSNIELIDENFSLEEEEPDIIYIHNPYDNTNFVSSVHPRYYSANLKKYTKTLVYIPYFITMGMSSFGTILFSAYLNMDFIVVQNEEHKKSLPEEVRKKAVILGSPKLDKAESMKKGDVDLPDAWKKIAKCRELVYYNSSIENMLEDTTAFLDKMKTVFTLFKNHPKCCLVWRPHPLLENTFRTLRKEYLPKYLSLKKIFCEEKIGIYDDTADLGKTAALSSLYMGDENSSVASAFSVMEKPLIILSNTLSLNAGEEREKIFLNNLFSSRKRGKITYRKESELSFHRDGNKSGEENSFEYGSAFGEEAIVYEGRFLLLPQLKGENVYLKKLNLTDLGISEAERQKIPADEYGEAYLYQGSWILCPKAGNHFLILETGKEPEKLYLQGFSCKPNAFSGSYRLGEYLFCKAENYPTDIRFSLKKKKVKELKERITEKEQEVNIYERLRYPELEGKLKLDFPLSDLISGFLPWRRFLYGLQETALYSLEDFLEEKPLPYPFDQGLSHRKVEEISVNIGTAGEKIHRYFQDLALQEK